MAKNQATKRDKPKLDVAGALKAIRSKKSREQIREDRLAPFVKVIDEARKHGWKWSPIVALIRKRGGPCLSNREAEELYKKLKGEVINNGSGLDHDATGDQLAIAPQEGGNEGEVA